jgi:hypothetical protein
MAYDPRLGHLFMFEEADLTANGRGQLSQEQERGFAVTVGIMKSREAKASIALVIIFAAVIALVVVAIANTPGGGLGCGIVAGAILTWILGIILFFRRRGRRLTRAFEEHRILTAEGPLNIRTTVTETWFAHVGRARFAVELYQAQGLEEDAAYRVHYLEAPDGDIPLSIERA